MALNPNPSALDQPQIIQRVFDSSNDRLRVDATVEATIGDLTISATDSDIAVADRLTGNLLKVNSDGSIDVNNPISAAFGDSIIVSDGTNDLNINPDGSLNVQFAQPTTTSQYNEVSSVANSVLTTIISYTATGTQQLTQIDVSGTNIATYSLTINSTVKDKRRTYFGSGLNAVFDYASGLTLTTGDIVTVNVIHERPSPGDFNARLQITGY